MTFPFSELPNLSSNNKRKRLPLHVQAFQKIWYDRSEAKWMMRTFAYPDLTKPRNVRIDRQNAMYYLRVAEFPLVYSEDSWEIIPLQRKHWRSFTEFEAHVLETLIKKDLECQQTVNAGA